MESKKDVKENNLKLPPTWILKPLIVFTIVFLSATLVNTAIRGLFGSSEEDLTKIPVNFDFPLIENENTTSLCPFLRSTSIYKLKLEQTSCLNKTLWHQYIPWISKYLWIKIDSIIEERRKLRIKKMEVEAETVPEAENNTAESTDELVTTVETPLEETKPEKQPEQPTSLVYTLLTAITTLLAVLACIELFKEKINKKPGDDARNENRRCSLAEFTIKRHQRKESQQENAHIQALFEEPKKVKELLHQGSLDRAISILTPPPAVKSKLPRQKSAPSRSPSIGGLLSDPRILATHPLLRHPSSLDLSEEDNTSSPILRRKSRHFIRRH